MNLNPGEVHIWSATINEGYEKLLSTSYLSEIEIIRSEMFSYDIDSLLFSVRHNLLRIILGGYLNCDPGVIILTSNNHNKPSIALPLSAIQFNISVSSNRFVAAFCLHHAIGVDVEVIRPIKNIKQLTMDYFTIEETAFVYNHPDSMLGKAFFNIWSKKEALIKAIGLGISLNLKEIDVISERPLTFIGDEWHLKQLTVCKDCTTALSINSPVTEVSYFNADMLL